VVITQTDNLEAVKSIGMGASDFLDKAFKAAMEKHGPNAGVAFVHYGRYSVFDV
jgi:hypothetical protein